MVETDRMDQKLELWKKDLLDKNANSPMVNVKETLQTLRVTYPEDMSSLFDNLVNNETVFEFPLYVPIKESSSFKQVETDEEQRSKEIQNEEPQFDPSLYMPVEPSHLTLFASSSTWKSSNTLLELKNSLRKIRSKKILNQDETGLHTLFMTFGSLTWYESSSSHLLRRSPIIIVPVNLHKYNIKDPFILEKYDDDIVLNPIIEHIFKHDFGITIPPFNDDDIDGYLDLVRDSIANNTGWEVVNECFLSHLSFRKIIIYRDLEVNAELYKEHPIINQLAGISSSDSQSSFSYETIDHDAIPPQNIFQVLDADSSQLDAIEYAKQGKSFVLQGPPGTGKSQTITNIITEMLGNGKKVLFVSEKMAALEVVASRIKKAGLFDYTLILQSKKEKTGRKQFIENLIASFSSDFKIENSTTIDRYYTDLSMKKHILTEYVKQVHDPILPLGMSMYQAQGFLAQLHTTSSFVSIEQAYIESFTHNNLREAESELIQIAFLQNKIAENNLGNYWENHARLSSSLQFKQQILMYGENLIAALTRISGTVREIEKTITVSSVHSLNELQTLLDVFSDIRNAKPIQPHWLKMYNLSTQLTEIEQIIYAKAQLQELNKTLATFFGIDYLQKDFQHHILEVEQLKPQLTSQFGPFSLENIDDFKDIFTWINKIESNYKDLYLIISKTSSIFHNLQSTEVGKLISLAPTFSIWATLTEMPPHWFSSPKEFQTIKTTLNDAKLLYNKHKKLEQEIDTKCTGNINEVDWITCDQWLQNHPTWTKILYPTFRQMRILVKEHCKKTLTLQSTLETINLLAEFQQCQKLINDNENMYKNILGDSIFQGDQTNWENAEAIIKSVEALFQYHRYGYPTVITTHILDAIKENGETGYEFIKVLTKSLDDINTVIRECPVMVNALKLELLSSDISIGKLTIKDSIGLLNELSLLMTSLKFSESAYNSSLFINVQRFKDLLENKLIIKNLGEKIFSSLNLQRDWRTDWTFLHERIQWSINLRSKNYYEFAVNVFGNQLYSANKDFVEFCSKFSLVLENQLLILDSDEFLFFTNLFIDKEIWKNRCITETIKHVEGCIQSIGLLEDLIKFEEITRAERISPILKNVIAQLTSKNINPDEYRDIFIKSFYTLWHDTYIKNFPSLEFFSIDEHNIISQEFKKLDVDQQSLASRRVKNILDLHRPNDSEILGGEALIIKREAAKKRKFKSIRRLMEEIPRLILDMKPCFLMSPLAVSQYLKPELYKFDVIIFDEASQIRTHDAISSILRGNQVIITGDTKQLPPTSFFETTDNDNDIDIIDDEEEDDFLSSYESVLEEASLLLPTLTLRWHYRSRYEHLIMFSNNEFYGNKLMTFPTQTHSMKNSGVEFIYTPDGMYDRGKSRRNKKEAEKVVDLIFEHIHESPTRSIGVVTCSQSQQICIEDILEKRREANPGYEHFFSEQNDEPFFIKNIETVQGDERDTILFSIGYAQSSPGGSIPMNFGPINKKGGEKRLNVAITRAKENLKVVCSFRPTLVNTSGSSSVGAKKLIAYLQYAENGMDSLIQSTASAESLDDTESVFEESVKQFLEEKGYSVSPQVGCSQYRIDLGLVHPLYPGIYVLGIECDGAQYHRGRTARERDRLRQDVLERMGWRIYRIWSTDWAKNPFDARKRLLEEVEKAVSTHPNDPLPPKKPLPALPEIDPEEMFISNESDISILEKPLSIDTIQLKQIPYFDDFIPNSKSFSIKMMLPSLTEYLKTHQPITLEYLLGIVKDSNYYLFGNNEFKKDPIRYLRLEGNFYVDKSHSIWLSKEDATLLSLPRRNSASNLRETTNTICTSEVLGLAFICIRTMYNPTSKEIIDQYKSIFSFKRAGSGIRGTVENALAILEKAGTIQQKEGKWAMVKQERKMTDQALIV